MKVNEHVRIIDAYVPNAEIQIYFSAADICIMPYISATGSGVAQIAYGFNVPIIATSVGCLKEIIQNGVSGFLVRPSDSHELAKKIIETITGNYISRFRQNIAKIKGEFSWEGLVKTISQLVG